MIAVVVAVGFPGQRPTTIVVTKVMNEAIAVQIIPSAPTKIVTNAQARRKSVIC